MVRVLLAEGPTTSVTVRCDCPRANRREKVANVFAATACACRQKYVKLVLHACTVEHPRFSQLMAGCPTPKRLNNRRQRRVGGSAHGEFDGLIGGSLLQQIDGKTLLLRTALLFFTSNFSQSTRLFILEL
jgi:hypothetical protein